MKYKLITPSQANKINRRLGLDIWEGDEKKTFWVTNENENATWSFDSNKERKQFIERHNK